MNVRANKLLLLVTSLATLALLGAAAYRENVLQDWRRIQRRYRAALPADAAEGFGVQLRQIVAPALGMTDRCVTCHLGMAPGEAGIPGDRLFAPHPRIPHDPADFGCTVCHGGQGRATETKAAHGDVHFWPEPMIPRAFSDAGCGACHTHLAVPGLAALRRGAASFERHDCLACHRLDGRGGTLRPGGAGGMEGPDLSTAGVTGYAPDWYARHLDRAAGGDPRWTASFGVIPGEDLAALGEFLDSRVGAPDLVEAKAVFHSTGCRGCHKVGGLGGDDGPDLTLIGQRDPGRLDFTHVPGERSLAAWFMEHFRAPAKVVPGSAMPEMGLDEATIGDLTLYMFSLRRAPVPEAFWPKDRIQAERFGGREFSNDGATLYGTFCAACHGTAGEGRTFTGAVPFPKLADSTFLALASDDFLTATIRGGRPGRRMPAWGGSGGTLTDSDIAAVVAHLRSLGGGIPAEPDPRPARWVAGDPREGKRLYEHRCAGCHGPNGEGNLGVALNNPVLLALASDTYLVETVRRGRPGTPMAGFGTSTSVTPALSAEEIEAIVTHIRTWEVKP